MSNDKTLFVVTLPAVKVVCALTREEANDPAGICDTLRVQLFAQDEYDSALGEKNFHDAVLVLPLHEGRNGLQLPAGYTLSSMPWCQVTEGKNELTISQHIYQDRITYQKRALHAKVAEYRAEVARLEKEIARLEVSVKPE